MHPGLVTLLSVAGGAATIAGGLVFAVMHRAYVAFYARFGLQPADVGLTQTDIVWTAAVGLLYLSAAALVAACLAWVVTALCLRTLSQGAGGLRHTQYTWTALLLVLGTPVFTAPFNDFALRPPYLAYFVTAVLAFSAAIAYSGHVQRPHWQLTLESSGVWAAALALVFFCATGFLTARAERLATDLLEDGRPDDTTFMFQVRRDEVCAAVQGERRRFVLLGQGEHGAVLLESTTETERVVRLADLPVVEFLPADRVAQDCDGTSRAGP